MYRGKKYNQRIRKVEESINRFIVSTDLITVIKSAF